MGFSSPVSLAVSIVIAGVADYFALEWWGFPGRKSGFSSRRLIASGAVELGTYLIRITALWLWKRYLNDIEPTEHLIGLAVAYGAGFVFGYAARSRLVFADGMSTKSSK